MLRKDPRHGCLDKLGCCHCLSPHTHHTQHPKERAGTVPSLDCTVTVYSQLQPILWSRHQGRETEIFLHVTLLRTLDHLWFFLSTAMRVWCAYTRPPTSPCLLASIQALTFDVTFSLLIGMEKGSFREATELREWKRWHHFKCGLGRKWFFQVLPCVTSRGSATLPDRCTPPLLQIFWSPFVPCLCARHPPCVCMHVCVLRLCTF